MGSSFFLNFRFFHQTQKQDNGIKPCSYFFRRCYCCGKLPCFMIHKLSKTWTLLLLTIILILKTYWKYSSSVGGSSANYSDVWVPHKQVMALGNTAQTTYMDHFFPVSIHEAARCTSSERIICVTSKHFSRFLWWPNKQILYVYYASTKKTIIMMPYDILRL